MKTMRGSWQRLSSILSIATLVIVAFLASVASLSSAARAQEIGLLTVEQASSIAQAQVLREKSIIPSWEGALASSPEAHYDLHGNIAAYVFSVLKDTEDVGYIAVSSKALPNPVLEFSTAPARYKATRSAVRSTAARLGLVIDEQRPLYLGMLAYFYRIGNSEPMQLIEMSARQVVSLGVTPVPPSQRDAGNERNSPGVLSNPLPAETSLSGSSLQSRSYKLLYGPDYTWYLGCGPTAVANAMGFWADRGYPNLMYGGSDGDYQGTIDRLAVLMGTTTGWTNLPINDDIINFAAQRGYYFQSNEVYMSSYATFVGEIDSHRPIVVLVNGHVFYRDHFITGFGYEYDLDSPNYRYMIVHDTWPTTAENYWVQYGTGYSAIWFDTVVPPTVQVDAVPPTSAVNPLPAYQTSDTFNVSWSGADVGWGIEWFDVEYRDSQNGVWTDWITQTSAMRADFTGTRGHTYCFRSRAMDIDHNQESYTEDADTCTTVLASLTINYPVGKPGSFFTLTGSNYLSNVTVTVTINGHYLGAVSTDSMGGFSLALDTTQADEGDYVVITHVSFDVSVGFRLDTNAPLRPEESSGPTFDVPGGIALAEFIYLPIVQR